MKILLSNVKVKGNFGYPSIVLAFETLIKKKNPYVQLYYNGDKTDKNEMAAREKYGLKTVDFSCLYRIRTFPIALYFAIQFWIFRRVIGSSKCAAAVRELSEYGAIIDLSGIGYTDKIVEQGIKRFLSIFFVNRFWIIAKIINVPVIKNTTAIGPCKKLSTKIRVKFDLGFLCKLVIARDEESFVICKKLKLRCKYIMCPDTAFCMTKVDSDKSEALKRLGKPLIGIGVSHQIEWRIDTVDYCDAVCEVIKELANQYDAHILLIPNEFDITQKRNDVIVAEKIKGKLPTYDVEVLDSESLRADEIKGIIAACDAVITARYHTMVAALSTGTPVFVMSWHHKYKTAMGLFGVEKYVIENDEINQGILISRILEFYKEREKIREVLNPQIQTICEKVSSGVDNIYNLLV